MINTRFWSDSWIREKLNPLDRYLFLYFLTNEHTNICGIYELSLPAIAFETGIDKEDLKKTMFPRLKPKVYYIDGWVCVTNFPRHQAKDNPKIQKGIEYELALIPSHILDKAIAYGYPIQGASHPNPNPNPNPKIAASPPIPFLLKDQIKKLEDNPRRDLNIIALYLEKKKPDIRTAQQLQSALKRHLRAAKALSAFDDDQILKACATAEKEYPKIWTIETLVKLLTK